MSRREISHETFISYWSGEEPTTGPKKAPTLDMTPDYLDVVVLFYVLINEDGSLNFDRLTLHNDQQTIKGWMQDIRTRQEGRLRKTKFTLGILGNQFPQQNVVTFAKTVKAAFEDWGVDGITIDYEPPTDDGNILAVVQEIRCEIGQAAIMTAPIYAAWIPWNPDEKKKWAALLKSYADAFDHIETMDYSPYTDVKTTTDRYEEYAKIIGTDDDPAYGRSRSAWSCMEPSTRCYTPLADVITLCRYQPPGATKAGIMLYALSYDVTRHGSGYPDGTFTKTIHENLP